MFNMSYFGQQTYVAPYPLYTLNYAENENSWSSEKSMPFVNNHLCNTCWQAQ